MAELIASRSIALSAGNPVLKSPTITIGQLTSSIALKLRRPTTAQPLSWDATGRVRVTLVFIVDGVEYKCAGQVSGGIRTDANGVEIGEYSLLFEPTVLFGQKSREHISAGIVDAGGYYNDVPLVRLGETGSIVQGYVLLERLSGTINTVVTLAATTESPAPRIRYKNSVAYDAATSAVESFGDGVLTLSHTASGADRAAFIGVAMRSATVGAGTTSYAGGGGSVTSSFTAEDAGIQAAIYGFYKTAPATTAQTVTSDITATTPDDHFLGVITMTGVDQTTPVGTAATDPVAYDVSPTVTVGSVAAGDMVVDLLINQGSPTVGASQTARLSPAATSYPSYFRCSTQSGTDGGVMSWSHAGNETRALGAVAFKEAAGGGGGRTTKNTRSHPLGMEVGMNFQGNL